ncbi:MAG: flagellar motor protein MotA [Rhodospirillaceae bacterium]|nr:flagellar motor protein MotA [Rhodospirillaceae bacterium]
MPSRPRRFLTRMVIFLVVAVIVAGVLHQPLLNAFMANAALNGLILGVLVLGILYNFRQVLMLRPDQRWIESVRREQQPGQVPMSIQPRLLQPMATMFRERKGNRLMLSAMAMRSLLDGISNRLDESRDISRYMVGLLIFLGLLGTFWGLLQTISSVGAVISSMSVGEGDMMSVFSGLKEGLQAPLSGMGTAFSSSLFGLGGSLVLGFLDLQASQAQNSFFNSLEDWLSSMTRLSSGGGLGEGDQSVPAYVQALLEQTADSLEQLQRTLSRGEDERRQSAANMLQLTERLATLTDQMRAEQNLMVKLAEAQMDMKPILNRLSDAMERDAGGGMDEATRAHIRNLDVYLGRLLEETVEGRNQVVQELRSEIKLLARTVAAVGSDQRRG